MASNMVQFRPQCTRSFSNKAFRKEVNLLARSSSKKKVLDLYATAAVQREQAKLAKRANKRKKSNDTSDNESDDDISVQLIEPSPSARGTIKSVSRAKHVAKKRSPSKSSVAKAKIATEDKLQEENAYQCKLQWLQDHGEPDEDEPLKNSEDESDN